MPPTPPKVLHAYLRHKIRHTCTSGLFFFSCHWEGTCLWTEYTWCSAFLRLLLFLVALLISIPHLYHSGWLCTTQFSLHYTEWLSPQITWAPTCNPICQRLFLPQGNLQSISSSKAISLPQGDSGAICEIMWLSSPYHICIWILTSYLPSLRPSLITLPNEL